ncbi:hypothetical protein [Microbacterium sp. KHB019]|uniref:hypothetical protein n=1 Tax=Microbacterium sp. KHB019 TaxID=3129770 RepID=UPI00307908D2
MSEPTPDEEELMTRDALDDLLDAAAPPAATVDDRDVLAMVTDARKEVRVAPRAKRAAVITGVLAILMAGGAGVATASSDWLWGDGLENPDRSYAYTSPTWGECEIRFSGFDTHKPLIQGDVNRVVDEWFANTDVEAAAEPFVAKYLAVMADSRDAENSADPRLPDLEAWTAHEQALSEALHMELKMHGYDSGALAGTDSHSQLHCEGEDWDGTGAAE